MDNTHIGFLDKGEGRGGHGADGSSFAIECARVPKQLFPAGLPAGVCVRDKAR